MSETYVPKTTKISRYFFKLELMMSGMFFLRQCSIDNRFSRSKNCTKC